MSTKGSSHLSQMDYRELNLQKTVKSYVCTETLKNTSENISRPPMFPIPSIGFFPSTLPPNDVSQTSAINGIRSDIFAAYLGSLSQPDSSSTRSILQGYFESRGNSPSSSSSFKAAGNPESPAEAGRPVSAELPAGIQLGNSQSPDSGRNSKSPECVTAGRCPEMGKDTQHNRQSAFSVRDILHPDFGRKAVSSDKQTSNSSNKQTTTEHKVHNATKNSTVKDCESPNVISERGSFPHPNSDLSNKNKNNLSKRKGSKDEQNGRDQAKSSRDGQDGGPHFTAKAEHPIDGSNLPAWVFCTRYSDRPCAGPRIRKHSNSRKTGSADDKRPRTAFTNSQLSRLREEFHANKYLGEDRRNQLATDLGLSEAQVKIWFQNRRAKLKKSEGERGELALKLREEGLYNHSTAGCSSGSQSPC